MSQITKPGSGGGGGSGITTINGDIGSITGSNVTIFANRATNNSGETVLFNNSGTVSTLNVTDSAGNTAVGRLAGNAALITDSGANNTAFGLSAGGSLGEGSFNVLIGQNAGTTMTADENATAVGAGALMSANNTNGCTAIGYFSLTSVTTGSYLTGLGAGSGELYTTEDSNVAIANPGVPGDANTLRIGSQGTAPGFVNKAFIAGIVGNTVSNAQIVTIDSMTGQLGVSSGGGSATVLSVGLNSSQSIPQNSLQNIVYDTVLVDTASGYNVGTGTYTVPSTNNYEITVTTNLLSTAGFMNADIFANKNSGTVLLGSLTVAVDVP